MITALVSISTLLVVLSVLPFVKNQHWVFRVPEFIKLQLLILQMIIIAITFVFVAENPVLWYVQVPQILLTGYHVYILMRYTKFWRTTPRAMRGSASEPVKIVSCNVYQFNKEYDRFIKLIQREQPDIFLTMESDAGWERAMRVLETDYPNFEKVTLDNTYGMHFPAAESDRRGDFQRTGRRFAERSQKSPGLSATGGSDRRF